jgi:tape measure domain-containing protein
MADVVSDRVIVELEAKLDRYNANVASAEQKFDRAMGNIQKSAGRAEAFVSRSVKLMAGALAGISTIAVARAFLDIADEAKNLDAQLKLATQSSGSFAQAQADVRRIADDTRSGLEETSRLYGNFQRNARQLGITQIEAARATETVAKTFRISGASTVEAAQATRQLVQALQSGVLRGDEFNSVMEAAPRLSRLLADSLGVPVGQLRAMAEQGELTAEKLTKAFTDTRFTAEIDAEFKQLPVTFDQAMTRVRNAAVITFGAFDRGGEFSTALANFVGDGADGFADLERKAEDFGISVRGTIEGLSNAFDPLFDTASALFEALGIKFSDIFSDGRAQIRDLLLTIDQATGWLSRQGALGAALTGNFDNYLNDRPRTGSNLLGRFNARVAASDMERQFNRQIRILEGAQNRGSSGGGGNTTPNPDLAKHQKLLADLEKLKIVASGQDLANINEKIAREKKIIGYLKTGVDEQAAIAAAGGRQSSAAKDLAAFKREEANLADSILRSQADLAVGIEDRTKIERDRIEKARVAAVAEVEADTRYSASQKKIVEALINQAAALEDAKAIRERDVQLAKEALDARVASIKNDQDLLKAEADVTDTREARRDIEMRLLDLAYQQERAELDALIASGDATKAQIAIAEQRKAILDQLQRAEVTGINQRYESPLERYRRRNEATSTQDQVEELVGQELDYVRDGIRDSITKRLGIKDPLLSGIIEMFIQKAIIGPITDALLSGIGGGGGVIGAISGFLGFAGGGSMTIGGRGGSDRNLLSLNGRPIANVSRGETLSVGNKTLGRSGGGATIVQQITIDARNSVTPEGFAREILAITGQQAIHAAAGMGQTVIKGVPTRLAQFQRDGT